MHNPGMKIALQSNHLEIAWSNLFSKIFRFSKNISLFHGLRHIFH